MKKINTKGFSIVEALIIIVVIGVIGALGWRVVSKQQKKAENKKEAAVVASKFVTADFIDLSKIYTVSKFRSLEGHDFSKGGETCRSMKHYFYPQTTVEGAMAVKANNGMPPAPDGVHDIDIYSPVDGTITQIASERMPVGEQLYIVPDAAKDFTIRLFHVYKSDGIKVGTKVKAGQKIGVISTYSATDISVETSKNYYSYFDVMTDEVLAKYLARGAKSKDDFILTKEYRDANAVTCNQGNTSDQKFNLPGDYDLEANTVRLSGYVVPDLSKLHSGEHMN